MKDLKSLFNVELLKQENFDSASPAGLGSVFHRLSGVGEYGVTFLRREEAFGRARLTVEDPDPSEAAPPQQVSIDLDLVLRPPGEVASCGADQRLADEAGQQFKVAANGYATFTSSRKTDEARDYTVLVEKAGGGRTEEFDSRCLKSGDLFAVTLIRPGTYALKNTITGSEGTIAVAYPTVGEKPYRPPEPVAIQCTDGSFSQTDIRLSPAQGIVFHIETPSRITIDLTTPDDGPYSNDKPVMTWRPQERPSKSAE